MTFAQFRSLFQSHLEQTVRGVDRLYEVNVDKDKLWNLYLDSFPADANVIYRKRREYDCSCCRSFVRAFGAVVAIRDMQVVSVWDFETGDPKFDPVLRALSAFVKRHQISDAYYTKAGNIGTEYNMENDDGNIVRWDHFSAQLPVRFVYSGHMSEGEYKGYHRDIRNVFKRSLDEISMDAVDTLLELIASNSLYRGQEWLTQLNTFKKYKKLYDALSNGELKEIFAWDKSAEAGAVVGKIRNHSIGVLLTDISQGMDLEQAVRRYENIVAPANYKRPKAVFTKKMLEDAQKKVMELGYLQSLPRRYARLNDISVNNILFCNRDAAPSVQGAEDVFAQMMADTTKKPMNFDRVEEISAEDFIKNVLPTARNVELYLENRHERNVVSLIAPENENTPSMFKWNNGFSWAYAGNATDSSLRSRVKELGGRVDGALRFSHTWNYDPANPNQSLMDLHVFMPGAKYSALNDHYPFGYKRDDKEIHDSYPAGPRVGWNRRRDHMSGGVQDVDYTSEPGTNVPVENITFPDITKLPEGKYTFKIHNWRLRHPTRSGFRAEIELNDGQIYQFEHPKPLGNKQWVTVAEATLHNGSFTLTEKIPSVNASRDIGGIKSNDFVPVSVVMYSPNYWDGQYGVGHKHCFFMLRDFKNPETPNGFYNEFLKQELAEHKRVFEALGSRMKVQESDDQLSGIGFSMTKRDDVIVRITGATKRVMNVKF